MVAWNKYPKGNGRDECCSLPERLLLSLDLDNIADVVPMTMYMRELLDDDDVEVSSGKSSASIGNLSREARANRSPLSTIERCGWSVPARRSIRAGFE